jgi:hypothetical protein
MGAASDTASGSSATTACLCCGCQRRAREEARSVGRVQPDRSDGQRTALLATMRRRSDRLAPRRRSPLDPAANPGPGAVSVLTRAVSKPASGSPSCSTVRQGRSRPGSSRSRTTRAGPSDSASGSSAATAYGCCASPPSCPRFPASGLQEHLTGHVAAAAGIPSFMRPVARARRRREAAPCPASRTSVFRLVCAARAGRSGWPRAPLPDADALRINRHSLQGTYPADSTQSGLNPLSIGWVRRGDGRSAAMPRPIMSRIPPVLWSSIGARRASGPIRRPPTHEARSDAYRALGGLSATGPQPHGTFSQPPCRVLGRSPGTARHASRRYRPCAPADSAPTAPSSSLPPSS